MSGWYASWASGVELKGIQGTPSRSLNTDVNWKDYFADKRKRFEAEPAHEVSGVSLNL